VTDAATAQQTTDPDQTRPPRLSDSKLIAIDTLLTGATHREAAEAAGVARTTVTEWVNQQGEFGSELERRRRERAAEVNDRVGAAIGQALRVVKEHLDAGDLRAALGLLRLVPPEALYQPPPAAQDPREAEDVGAILRARLLQLEAGTT
jgi:transposase-like protein